MQRFLMVVTVLVGLLLGFAPASAQYVELWTKRSTDPGDAPWFDLGDPGGTTSLGENMPVHAHSSEGSWAGSLAHFTRIFMSPGVSHNAGPFTTPLGLPPLNTVYGDTNGDGIMEFVSNTRNASTEYLVVWNGISGAEEAVIPYPAGAVSPLWIHLLDMNGDGRDEILFHWLGSAPAIWGTTAYGYALPPLGVAKPTESPAEAKLSSGAPNPFRGDTVLEYDLPRGGEAALRVFDAQGRQVRSLVEASRPAGSYRVAWDGRDDSGRRLEAGVYFFQLEAAGARNTRKTVLLK